MKKKLILVKLYKMTKRVGRKSIAQTPAPKSDIKYGSKVNKAGSASAKESKTIQLSEKTLNTLKDKLAEFKKKHPNKKNITLSDLKAVYRRGSGAYSKSHRPTITGGAPNSRAAWSFARVNKFLLKAGGTKVKAAYVQDDDLIKYDDGGLIAPNGKPSNLTPEQYKLVRTPEFKAWFGDWENDPKNASMVVDENGEPLVVYHGSRKKLFTQFKNYFERKNKPIPNDRIKLHFFTNDRNAAKDYGTIIYECFLSMKNPLNYEISVGSPEQAIFQQNKDGFILESSTSIFAVPKSNQIKLADGTNTTFDIDNQDIRYSKGGKTFNDKELLSKWKKGESIGFTGEAHLKAKGLIPRADGTKRKSEKYMEDGGELGQDVVCENCGWEWNTVDSDANDKYVCHKCGFDNTLYYSNDIFAKGGKTKGGDCYVKAGSFCLLPNMHEFIGEPYLVHAEVRGQGKIEGLRYGHAWVEDDENVYDYSNGRQIVMPKQIYYLLGDIKTDNPKKYQKYSFPEARAKMLKTKHYGSWDIETDYADGGLIAPNGNKSNLTPEQYKLVRTPEFKAWFGDWENDPQNASKVVDENGEPKVMWHGSTNIDNINVFSNQKGYDYNFFTPDFYEAMRYADKKENIKPFFLNLKKIFNPNSFNENEKFDSKKIVELLESWFIEKRSIKEINEWKEDVLSNKNATDFEYVYSILINSVDNWIILENPIFQKYIKINNYDSFTTNEGGGNIGVYNTNNIKLADGTNTTFDIENQDIRYKDGGLINPSIKNSNLEKEQYKIVRTPQFKSWFGDWQNDPNNASKVVDENGEPMVVWHGSPSKFNIFKSYYPSQLLPQIFYFAENAGYAEYFTDGTRNIKPYFLNIRKMFDAFKFDTKPKEAKFFIKEFGISTIWLKSQNKLIKFWELLRHDEEFRQYLKNQGYDGVGYFEDNDDSWVEKSKAYGCFYANQIKLANGINTTFVTKNKDVRYENGGEMEEYKDGGTVPKVLYHYTNDKVPIISTHKDRLVPNSLSTSANKKDWSFWGKNLFEITLPENAKMMVIDKNNYWQYGKQTDTPLNRGKEIYKEAKKNKIDVIYFKKMVQGIDEYAVLNKDFKYKKILTPEKEASISFKERVKLESELLRAAALAEMAAKEEAKTKKFEKGGEFNPDDKKTKEMITHKSGSAGGMLVGNRHSEGGIKAINKSSNTPLEMEGGEVVITRNAVSDEKKYEFEGEMLTNREILSKINESGGGVSFAKGGDIMSKFKKPMSIEEIANEYGIDSQYVENQLEIGTKHELEHTNDKEIANIIALHHIGEKPNYYELVEKYKLEQGGQPSKFWHKSEKETYEIPDFIKKERMATEELLCSSDTRISKAIICRAKIDFCEKKEANTRNLEEKNAWSEVKHIWEACLQEIKNGVVYEYKDGGECGCASSKKYKNGGLAYGNSHDKGGMPLKVQSTGQNIEIEGGEGVVNKRSMQIKKRIDFEGKKLTPCQIVSKINQMGGGVKFKCDDVAEILEKDGSF